MALRAEEIQDSGVVDLDRDRSLVLRYQRGDESAFDELYRRYYPRLHLYCQRRVGDAHASEELAQEAFLRALRAMPRFAGERRFYPWMTVIAQRLCIDHHRRTSRVEPSADIDLGSVEADHDALYAEVDRDHLSRAMERLAPRHRDVLELRETKGWSYLQIAEHLDVPVTTVEALLHRARKALKREFVMAASGNRLAGVPVAGWIMFRMARVRAAVSGKTATQLAPIAGSAAAGVAAVGLVLNPFAAAPALPTLNRPPAAVALATTSKPQVSPVSVVLPDAAPAGAVVERPRGAASSSTTPPPAPVVTAGPVEVLSGPEGSQRARDANDEQPLQVDSSLIDAGLNPAQTIHDVMNHIPGGNP